MNRWIRTGMFVPVAVCGLAVIGQASAAFAPRFSVSTEASGTTIVYDQAASDDPAAMLSFYVPSDYIVQFGGTSGSEVGKATAKVALGDSGGSTSTVTGNVRFGDPVATPALADAAKACTGVAAHTAILTVDLPVAGQTLEIPLFLDQLLLSSPAASFAAYTMVMCPPAPDTPVGTAGRSPGGAKLLGLSLSLAQFTIVPGWYQWHLTATPYTPAAGSRNTAGAVEAEAVDRTPQVLTLKQKTVRSKGARHLVASGRLTIGGKAIGGQAVQLLAGTSVVATAKTDSSGAYRVAISSKRPRGALTARAKVGVRYINCSGAVFAPLPCTSSSYGGAVVVSNR